MKLMNSTACALVLGLAGAAIPQAQADTASDIAQIRKEMKSLRGEYEQKIDELEKRLKDAEQRAANAEAKAASAGTVASTAVVPMSQSNTPAVLPPTAPTPRAATSQSAFNPAIAVALNGSFNHVENEGGAIPGFLIDEEAGLPDRGFTLDESEINISANVDTIFSANLAIAFEAEEGGVAVEEAFIQTLSLPGGITARAGRFFSGIGYLNDRHAHDWQFMDASLPYRAFLGGQYGDDGIGVRWLAPTDFYLQFGAEWFRGEGFPGGGADDNGTGTIASYVRTGADLNEEWSFLAGASYLRAKAQERDIDGDIFTGESDLGIATLVVKWAQDGNPKQGNMTFSGEYFFGNEDGDFNGTLIDMDRTGWYAQAVYQINPQWTIGARYSALDSDSVPVALLGSTIDNLGHSPSATSLLLEYDTSEFGRLRLQYTHDDSDIESNNILSAGYTVIIGPHAAHRY